VVRVGGGIEGYIYAQVVARHFARKVPFHFRLSGMSPFKFFTAHAGKYFCITIYRGMLELFRCAKLSFITTQPYLKFGISPVTWCRMTDVEFILEHLFSQHLCSLSHLLVNSTCIIHRSVEVFEYVDCRVII